MRTGCVLTGRMHLMILRALCICLTPGMPNTGPTTLKGAKLSDSAGPTKLHHQDGQVVLAPAFTVAA